MALREVLAWLGVKVEGTEQVDKAQAAMDRYVSSISAAKQPAQTLSRDIDRMGVFQARAAQSGGQLSFALRGAGAALGAVAGAALVAHQAFDRFATVLSEVIDLGDELDKASQRLGVGRQALQEWRYIADRSGVATEQLDTAFMTLNRNATAAARGGGEAVQAFRQLHVQLREGDGQMRDTSAVFEETMAALAGVSSEMERAAIASRIFGESGARLLPIVNEGEEGLAQLRARFRELGGGFSDDVIDGAAGAQDALTDFRLAMMGLKGVLAASVLPAVTRFVTMIADGAAKLAELVRTSSAVHAVLGLLAAAAAIAAVAFLPVIVGVGALVLVLGGLFLVVEDVVTAFRGGDSVFGRFVERLLSAMGITMTFTGAVEAFGVAWDEATANAREGLASLLEGLVRLQRAAGLEVSPGLQRAAVHARAEAGAARARATTSVVGLAQRERERQAERARQDAIINAPPPPVVETRAGRARRERERETRSSRTVTLAPVINVNGAGDPEVTARVVRRELTNVLRNAAETLPQAGEAT